MHSNLSSFSVANRLATWTPERWSGLSAVEQNQDAEEALGRMRVARVGEARQRISSSLEAFDLSVEALEAGHASFQAVTQRFGAAFKTLIDSVDASRRGAAVPRAAADLFDRSLESLREQFEQGIETLHQGLDRVERVAPAGSSWISQVSERLERLSASWERTHALQEQRSQSSAPSMRM